MKIPNIFVAILVSLLLSCSSQESKQVTKESVPGESKSVNSAPAKIKVLNFATFHMGYTTDASSVEFDQHNAENRKKAHDIAKKLAAFEPTVLIIEIPPEYDDYVQRAYSAYLNNPDTLYEEPNEVELLAFEVGRIAGTERIYGIDHKMGYNYMIGDEIVNTIDSVMHDSYYENIERYYPNMNLNEDSIDLFDKLALNNSDQYLDFMIEVNADMLTHAGTDGNFEGADEAARYYQRNLRMYSNLNRLDLSPDDRVFILMGSSHTAFFRDFMSRSPKYEMVNTFDYLK